MSARERQHRRAAAVSTAVVPARLEQDDDLEGMVVEVVEKGRRAHRDQPVRGRKGKRHDRAEQGTVKAHCRPRGQPRRAPRGARRLQRDDDTVEGADPSDPDGAAREEREEPDAAEGQGEARQHVQPAPVWTAQDEESAWVFVRAELVAGLDHCEVGLGPKRVADGFMEIEA